MMDCKKTKYATEKDAKADIDRFRATSTRSTIPIRSYHCGDCGAWHVTSKTPLLVQNLNSALKKITELEAEIENLKSKTGLKERIAVKIDERVAGLQKRDKKQQELIKKLRNDYNTILGKMFALEKQKT